MKIVFIFTLIAVIMQAQPSAAFPMCTTDTYTIDGRTIMCTTCCHDFGCDTFC